MVDALYSDLNMIKQLNTTIGKQRFGETALDFFRRLFPKLIWYGLSHQKVMANSNVFTLHQKRNYG